MHINTPWPPSLAEECGKISVPDPALARAAKARLDTLTKPLGSLGRLEELAVRLYKIQASIPLFASPARMYTIAGDHGVVNEGVAASPQSVTGLMVANFLAGGAAVNCLCAAADADLRVVDAGMLNDPPAPHPLLIAEKIARGTANIAQGPAMSREECDAALLLGVRLAEQAHQEGVRVLGTGEMGIGNTTPSSALFCAYLGFSAAEMTGMGAGVPPAGLVHKTAVIDKALFANAAAIDSGDPLAVLAALGGLEIAALAGLIIGGAARRMCVVVDGFISTAAYVAASRIAPAVSEYCVFSHGSAEAGHGRVLERLGHKPFLDLGMRLGEGTGAALGFFLLKAAAAVFNDMATFDQAGIMLRR